MSFLLRHKSTSSCELNSIINELWPMDSATSIPHRVTSVSAYETSPVKVDLFIPVVTTSPFEFRGTNPIPAIYSSNFIVAFTLILIHSSISILQDLLLLVLAFTAEKGILILLYDSTSFQKLKIPCLSTCPTQCNYHFNLTLLFFFANHFNPLIKFCEVRL